MSYLSPDLAIVLTVRMGSERLPGKVMVDINGKPLLHWIIERLRPLAPIVVASSAEPADDAIGDLCKRLGIPRYARTTTDVVALMNEALNAYYPEAKFVIRALGDCPLTSPNLTKRMIDVMDAHSGDAFVWHTMPYALPLYGSRETPYSREAWERIVSKAATPGERQHVDFYFQAHRDEFKIIYHEPPPNVYFRPYRVEVDWPEDVEVFRAIAKDGPGLLAPTPDIVRWLDAHPDVTRLNGNRTERTGPVTSFSYHQHRKWVKLMTGKAIVLWDDQVWDPPSKDSQPIMCRTGTCFLGFADNGILHTREAHIAVGSVDCECGLREIWNPKRKIKEAA